MQVFFLLMIDSMICLSRYICCIFFFIFRINFGETKQIVIALVATAFKIMFSVAKANVRLSGREFYAGDIDNLFWNIHNQYSPNKQKVRQPKSAHRKTLTPIVAKQSLHSIALLYNQAGVAFLPKLICLIV